MPIVTQLPEVFPLTKLPLMGLLEGRIEDGPQHDHVAGEVQPNHHGDEGPDRLVRDDAVAEDHRVEGEQPRQPHPKQCRHESPRHRIAQANLGVGDEVVEEAEGDKKDGEGHRPPPGVEEVDVFPPEVEDRLNALQYLFTQPVEEDDHEDDGQHHDHPDE